MRLTKSDLKIMLAEGEGQRIEFKESFSASLTKDIIAFANALYNISICIFDNRVEIASPGGLPKPLTIRDLGSKSKRRNETIADLFSRLDFVEKLGTGISKMRRWTRAYGLKTPKMETNGFFTITFNRVIVDRKDKMLVKGVGKMSVKANKRDGSILIDEVGSFKRGQLSP